MVGYRPRLNNAEQILLANFRKQNQENNVLVIGDLHEPFCLDGYLEFCKETYYNYDCNKVVFIGDVIDSHASSYHEQDPDGMGGGDELDLAIVKLKVWHDAFPNAIVTIGNHDRIAYRKAFSGGIPKRWMKPFSEVLETPTWDYQESFIYDDVLYEHGEGSKAITKAKNNMMSSVCGHTHTEAYVQWMVGKRFKIFGMQVGCGVDAKSYATAYAKNFKKQAIGCGIVKGGHTAFNVMMDL